MEVTYVSVRVVDEGKLKGYANIVFDNCFMVRGFKVIEGNKGLFVAMPNKKSVKGEFRDGAHPLDRETGEAITKAVLDKYQQEKGCNAPPGA